MPAAAHSVPGDEEQRVARQERRDHEPGLAEHDHEQQRVDPRAVLLQQRREMPVEVDHEVPEEGEELHGRAAYCIGAVL